LVLRWVANWAVKKAVKMGVCSVGYSVANLVDNWVVLKAECSAV
jgi:hypothetical protein